MKNMKLMLTAFAVVLMMNVTAFAQVPQKGADRGNRMMTMMTEQLDLNEEQVAKITTIQQEFREKMRALRTAAGADTDRNAMRAEMQKIGVEQQETIKAVLSKEQLAKWETIKTERGQTRPGGVNRPDVQHPTKGKPSMDTPTKGKPSMDRPTKGKPSMDTPTKGKPSMDRPTRPAKGKPAVKPQPMKRPKPSVNNVDRFQKALGLSDKQATELKAINKAYHTNMKALRADGAKKRKIKKAEKKYKAAVKNLLTAEQFGKWTSMMTKKNVKQADMLK